MTTTTTGAPVVPTLPNAAAVDPTVSATDPTLTNTELKTDAKSDKPVDNPFKDSKHRVKIDGNDLEIDYDELVKGYQTNKASLTRMQQATKDSAQAKDIIKLFKTDPEQAAKMLGVNAIEWAEKFMQREAELALKSPEEREKMKLLDELKALKDEKTASDQTKQQAELEHRTNLAASQLDTQFTQALATAGLPKTRGTIQRMAQYMLQFAEAGHDVSPEDVISYVKKDYEDEHRELWGASDLDQLYKQLGEDNIKKIIKMHNTKVKGESEPKMNKGDSGNTRAKSGDKPKDMKKFFRELRGGRAF